MEKGEERGGEREGRREEGGIYGWVRPSTLTTPILSSQALKKQKGISSEGREGGEGGEGEEGEDGERRLGFREEVSLSSRLWEHHEALGRGGSRGEGRGRGWGGEGRKGVVAGAWRRRESPAWIKQQQNTSSYPSCCGRLRGRAGRGVEEEGGPKEASAAAATGGGAFPKAVPRPVLERRSLGLFGDVEGGHLQRDALLEGDLLAGLGARLLHGGVLVVHRAQRDVGLRQVLLHLDLVRHRAAVRASGAAPARRRAAWTGAAAAWRASREGSQAEGGRPQQLARYASSASAWVTVPDGGGGGHTTRPRHAGAQLRWKVTSAEPRATALGLTHSLTQAQAQILLASPSAEVVLEHRVSEHRERGRGKRGGDHFL